MLSVHNPTQVLLHFIKHLIEINMSPYLKPISHHDIYHCIQPTMVRNVVL